MLRRVHERRLTQRKAAELLVVSLRQVETLQFQRKLFLLENAEHAQRLAGKAVTVCESDDGTVTIRDGKHILPARHFEKDDARISQGAIVSNKLLAGALQHIKDQQALKDQAKFPKLRTRRERRLLKKRATEVA